MKLFRRKSPLEKFYLDRHKYYLELADYYQSQAKLEYGVNYRACMKNAEIFTTLAWNFANRLQELEKGA